MVTLAVKNLFQKNHFLKKKTPIRKSTALPEPSPLPFMACAEEAKSCGYSEKQPTRSPEAMYKEKAPGEPGAWIIISYGSAEIQTPLFGRLPAAEEVL
jgi:hypothetical protein